MTTHVWKQQNVAFDVLLKARPAARSVAYIQPLYLVQTRQKTTTTQRGSSPVLSAKLRRFPPNVISDEPKHPEISLSSKYATKGIVPDLSTTRPAVLTLPKRDDPQYKSKFQYFFALGKSYGRFYLTGIKNVWRNTKTAREISNRSDNTSLSSLAKYPQNHPQPISYNEYELSIRNVYDVKKLIPFGLIFAICGEFTPLVVLAFGSAVVPNTCRIPKQREQDLQKQIQRDERYMQEAAALLRQYGNQPVPEQDSATLLAYLHNLTWFSKPLPLIGSLHSTVLIRSRRANHSNELLCSLVLIQREGGFSKRSALDVWEWGNKYGLYALRNYARKAVKEGKDPRSEDMKKELLSHFERESRYILDVDWRRLDLGAQWLAARNGVLGNSESPDTVTRRKDLMKIIKEQESASLEKTKGQAEPYSK